ncbi:hypothetical protein HPP92_025361 [Vanilla planifolia]|uniref:HVA22-like protein n=1 Tax=Vanilla planifolia TaxID=51239 RepID=A0A835UA47_VANPL|nr:hypothetical protein HPP92_025662 [Vanilla planifolia]KAG0454057.1 hypothetical protein HPP92_025361 [Vanilla planifolia]
MIGSFLSRALALVLGYAYPAYECFKTVELNRPEIEQLRFWCQYWILVAALTVFERIGDAFISWLPMYSEAKVAFLVYLWYPQTRGTTYVYETFFRPYVACHEPEIDRNLLELRARAGDIVFLYWQKAASYGQTRVFEIFQYIASQAPQQQSKPRSTMRKKVPQMPESTSPALPGAPNERPQQSNKSPLSPSKSRNQEPVKSTGDLAVPPPAKPRALPGSPQRGASDSASRPSTSEGDVKQTAAAHAVDERNVLTQEEPMEEAIPMAHAKLRKRTAIVGPTT